MDEEINYSVYKAIDIEFLGERRSILVKNDNGDCCLLAICNALSLSNSLTLEAKNNTEERELKSLLVEKLQSLCAQVLKERLSDAVLAVSNLDTYVPYPTWDRVDGFKKTEKDCKDIFQILGIPFYHGWLVDIGGSSSVLESEMARRNTRITETGLRRLVETIQDNEICVLYHNKDFYTATKYEGEVYMLVTDDVPGSDIRWVKPDGVFAKEDFSARSLSGSSDSDGEEDMNRENDAEDYVAAEGRGLEDYIAAEGGGFEDVAGQEYEQGGLDDAAAEGGLEDVAGQEYAQGGGLEYAEHLGRVSPASVLDIPSSGSSDNE